MYDKHQNIVHWPIYIDLRVDLCIHVHVSRRFVFIYFSCEKKIK